MFSKANQSNEKVGFVLALVLLINLKNIYGK